MIRRPPRSTHCISSAASDVFKGHLVGYLLAGVLAGPFTPGFVADTKLAPELAELGVILLMFGVGLHFSLKDLMAVKSLSLIHTPSPRDGLLSRMPSSA